MFSVFLACFPQKNVGRDFGDTKYNKPDVFYPLEKDKGKRKYVFNYVLPGVGANSDLREI